MLFLMTNQQCQSTEGSSTEGSAKIKLFNIPQMAAEICNCMFSMESLILQGTQVSASENEY